MIIEISKYKNKFKKAAAICVYGEYQIVDTNQYDSGYKPRTEEDKARTKQIRKKRERDRLNKKLLDTIQPKPRLK